MDFRKIATSPAFWAKFLEIAAIQTEKAAPNYTVGHKAAAVVGSLFGDAPISTPDAAHAESLAQAIGEGVKAAVLAAVQVEGA